MGQAPASRLSLEPWQRGFLAAVDREQKPIVSLMAGSQIGKTLIALGIGIREAVDGHGVLHGVAVLKSRSETSRVDSIATLEHAPVPREALPVAAVRARRARRVGRIAG